MTPLLCQMQNFSWYDCNPNCLRLRDDALTQTFQGKATQPQFALLYLRNIVNMFQ